MKTTVEDLACTMARIPWELLAANKSIVNRALELMGRNTLQHIAAETDAIAHQAPIVKEFARRSAAGRPQIRPRMARRPLPRLPRQPLATSPTKQSPLSPGERARVRGQHPFPQGLFIVILKAAFGHCHSESSAAE